MNSCSTTPAKKAICPANGRSYSGVHLKTILHQAAKPWTLNLPDQGYFFCDDPDCDIVYFGEDQSTLLRGDLRTIVGQKSRDKEKTICYCFDVQSSDLDSDKDREKSKAFVIEQTKNSTCDCELRNPSGKCCLKNFPQ